MTPSPDRQSLNPDLLARVAQGDEQAFEDLYGHSCGILYTLALRMLRNPDEAADLLQELYRDVWQKAASYDRRRGTPMAWLVMMTRSRAVDRLRSASAESRTPPQSIEEDLMAALQSDAPDPFEISADQEERELVAKAMAELPALQQQALELAFYEGLTHTQIAQRLNQPIGTIKTRIKLGLDKLRAALSEHGKKL
jgi:RNA polymerase sigma-70 factor (ECF subfamily)